MIVDGKSEQGLLCIPKSLKLAKLVRFDKSNAISTSTKMFLLRSVVFSAFSYGSLLSTCIPVSYREGLPWQTNNRASQTWLNEKKKQNKTKKKKRRKNGIKM